MTPIQRNFAFSIAIVVTLGAGIYYWTRSTQPAAGTSDNATTTVQILPDGTVVAPEGYTVTEQPVEQTIAAPAYKTGLKFDAGVSPEVRAALEANLKALQAAIDKDRFDFSAWVRLGGIRKTAGDYQGAAEIWTYTSKQWPGSSVSFNNLGDLYMNFLKDYAKAEAAYKQVVKLDPQNVDAYANLYYLYRDLYKKGTGADKAIVEAGLKANPGNQTLLALQTEAR